MVQALGGCREPSPKAVLVPLRGPEKHDASGLQPRPRLVFEVQFGVNEEARRISHPRDRIGDQQRAPISLLVARLLTPVFVDQSSGQERDNGFVLVGGRQALLSRVSRPASRMPTRNAPTRRSGSRPSMGESSKPIFWRK